MRLFYIFLLLLLVHGLFAQPGPLIRQSREVFKEGEAALLAKDYKLAQRYFERAIDIRPKWAAPIRLLAVALEMQGNYTEAIERYLQVIKIDPMYSRSLYYQLGEVYYKIGRPELALSYYDRFRELQDLPFSSFGLRGELEQVDELVFLDRLENRRRACEMMLDSAQFINITEIKNLGNKVNSPLDDYFPFLNNQQDKIFFTRHEKSGDEDLFYSTRVGEYWRMPERVHRFNTKQPEGMSTLVRNGRTIYFTACGRDTLNGGPCDLWQARVEDNGVTDVQIVEGAINSDGWESQSAVSCDGRKLYFASNRPGGVGGSDIWVSERLANGQWSRPRNLGVPLNTPQDEEAPFISNDGKTLYFSSTGHSVIGDQDIFMSWWDERLERWSAPINLAPPVNSPHRELGFFLSSDGKTGYFASDRPGGEGGMDIYTFQLSEQLHGEPITFVDGALLDKDLRTPVEGLLSLNGEISVPTDEQGRFFLCVPAATDIQLEAKIDDYRPYDREFRIPAWSNHDPFKLEVLLESEFGFLADLERETPTIKGEVRRPEREMIHKVYFEYKKDNLQEHEMDRLDGLMRTLSERPVHRWEIVGWADSVGSEEYNLALSEARAKSVAYYLIQKNVPVHKLKIKGLGTEMGNRDEERKRRVDIKIYFRD